MLHHLCPECTAGKHVNCVGQAWDLTLDKPVPCECPTCHPRTNA